MSLRRWVREQLLHVDPGKNDPPRGGTSVNNAREGERKPGVLGEYDSRSYPADLAERLRRRAEVAAALLRIDVTDPAERVAAIPKLGELLRGYPHPLVYETLIRAYLDVGRFDEARGLAFAARERWQECLRSPYPEIRAEIDGLQEWNPEDIDALRDEAGQARR